ITAAELQNLSSSNFAVRALPANQQGPQAPIPFLLVPREEPGQQTEQRLQIARTLLTRYDRNKNGKLSREEIGFPKELFDWLKAGETAEVNSIALARWLLAMPDVELNVRVGFFHGVKQELEVVQTGRQQVPTLPVEKVTPTLVKLKQGKT